MTTVIDEHLRAGSLRELFIEHLGWDHARGTETIEIDGNTIELERVAQKRGFLVLLHVTDRARAQTRRYIRQIQSRVSRLAHEHLLVVMDHRSSVQVWTWAYRQDGRWKHRHHPVFTNQIPSSLIEQIEQLAIAIEEEESTTLVHVTQRVQQALDTDPHQDIFFRRPGYAVKSQELAHRMREGGTREFHEFVTFHRRMPMWFAQRYKGVAEKLSVDLDDLSQVASIALLQAAKRFDPAQGTAFSTYAYAAMKNECQRWLSALRRSRHRLPTIPLGLMTWRRWSECLGAVEYTHDVYEIGLVRHPLAEIMQTEVSLWVSAAIESLDEIDQRVVRGRFGLGCRCKTLEEIGREIGVTKERVRQREKKAKVSLRQWIIHEFEGNGNLCVVDEQAESGDSL